MQNVQHKFDELARDPRFRFFGNTLIASSTLSPPQTALTPYTYPHAARIPFETLAKHYNAVLFTYGSSLSNPLSVPGSSSSADPLSNVYPALALVSWYNGHPAFADLRVDLSEVRDVTVVGQGNVALDVARILLKDWKGLEKTDIPTAVLEVLSKSRVETVSAVGRRGPGQVAFTTKEFREMLHLPDVRYTGIDPELLTPAKEHVGNDRMRKRLLELMARTNDSGSKAFELDFLKSPKAFLPGRNGRVGSVEWTVNTLLPPPPASPLPPASQVDAVPAPPTPMMISPTNESTTTMTDMVVESVGYRSEPIDAGVPFDAASGRVRNTSGRVTDEHGMVVRPISSRLAYADSRCRGCMPLGGPPAVQWESSLLRCTMPTPSPK